MKGLCIITRKVLFRHVSARAMLSASGGRQQFTRPSATDEGHSLSSIMTGDGPKAASFLSVLIPELESLRKRWTRNFRVCITNSPLVVIEATPVGTQNWTTVTTVDASRLPMGLIESVENALSSSSLPAEACGFTLLNLHERTWDIAVAEKALAEQFPRLRLNVDHSKGTDLQGTVTHTVSVSLIAQVPGSDLSVEEQTAKEAFLGESIGIGFLCTARRALREAFEAAGISPPTRYIKYDQGASEMDIYLEIIRNATNKEIRIVPSFHEDNQVRIFVESCDGRQFSILDGRRDDALSIALACVEKAAENVNSIATEEARKRIADHPVVLALPSKGLRHKEILRRLLFHTYGLGSERIRILTSQSDSGTFATTVDAELRWGETHSLLRPVVVTVARAAGVNKKAAEELACLTAIQRCFPRIYKEQLSYHSEVREIMSSSKATSKDSICPHVSKGLLAQVRWAAQCQGKEVVLEAVQLLPNSENEAFGIQTTRALWATQLFLVCKNGTREFISLALAPKKSASEQKVIAATLWKCFREECREGVQYAIDRGLIGKDGCVDTCEGISSSTPLPKNDYELAEESDPFISNLQILPSQLISVSHRQSLLSVFRRGVQLYVELLNERCEDSGVGGGHRKRLVESTEKLSADNTFRAQLFVKPVGNDDVDEAIPLGEATHSNMAIVALFSAFKSLFEEDGVIAKASKEDSQVCEIYRDTCQRAAELPPFPSQLPAPNPLETVAQCVMLKYGLVSELRISRGLKMVQVQIFGKSPASFAADMSSDTLPFFLGHGKGNSVLQAVVSCCKRIFNTHIHRENNGLDPMAVETMRVGSVQLPLQPKSILSSRLGDVMRELLENNAVSSASSIGVRVYIHSECAETMYEAQLYVVDGPRVVELERTPMTTDLLVSFRHLIESVAREVGGPVVDFDAMQREFSGFSRCNTLRHLIDALYGFPLVVETALAGQQWQCRLSVHLVEDLYYAVGYSTNTRKKEAIETAATKALSRCFEANPHAVEKQVASSLTTASSPPSFSLRTPQTQWGAEELSGLVYRKLVTQLFPGSD